MSATSVVVAANMNKVAAIVLAWFVFNKPLSIAQIFGVLICIAGGISYAIEVKKAKAMAKQQAIELAEAEEAQALTSFKDIEDEDEDEDKDKDEDTGTGTGIGEVRRSKRFSA